MPVRLRIKADTATALAVVDVSRFLSDFLTLYEAAQVFSNDRYVRFRSEWGRMRVDLAADDQLYVERLAIGSLELWAIAKAVPSNIAAISGLVTALEKVRNWRLERAVKEETLTKLRRENADARAKTAEEVAQKLQAMVSGDYRGPAGDEVSNRVQSIGRSPVVRVSVRTETVSGSEDIEEYFQEKLVKRTRRKSRTVVEDRNEPMMLDGILLTDNPNQSVLEQVKRFLASKEATRLVPPGVLQVLQDYVQKWDRA